MTFTRLSFLCALGMGLPGFAPAQEVVPPTNPSENVTNTPGIGGAAPALPGPIDPRKPSGGVLPSHGDGPATDTPLMPDQTPSLDKPESGFGTAPSTEKQERKSKTEVFKQGLKDRVRFRQVETLALTDRAVQVEWEHSFAARTEAEKRAALQKYYKLLYARMLKIDSSIKTMITLQATDADHRLLQTRISPTETKNDGERSTAGRVFSE